MPATVAQIQMIQSAANAYGADPNTLYYMAKYESGFQPNVVNTTDSNAAAGHPSRGLMQFIQSTFDAFSRKAKAANPLAWQGVPVSINNQQAQALTASWAIQNGHTSDWTTYARASSSAQTTPLFAASSTKLGKVTGDTVGLDPTLMQRLQMLAARIGKTLSITSGYRTLAEQQSLYSRYLAGTGNLAAVPGTSKHETGKAADVYAGSVPLENVPGAAAAAAQLGITFPVSGEAWHTQLAPGTPNVTPTDPSTPIDAMWNPLTGARDWLTGGVSDAASSVMSWAGEEFFTLAISFGAILIGGALIVYGTITALGKQEQAKQLGMAAATKGAMA